MEGVEVTSSGSVEANRELRVGGKALERVTGRQRDHPPIIVKWHHEHTETSRPFSR